MLVAIALPYIITPITVKYGQWEYADTTGENPSDNGYARHFKVRISNGDHTFRVGLSGRTDGAPRLFFIFGDSESAIPFQTYIGEGGSNPTMNQLFSFPRATRNSDAQMRYGNIIHYQEDNLWFSKNYIFQDYWLSYNTKTYTVAIGRGTNTGKNLGIAFTIPSAMRHFMGDPSYFCLGSEGSNDAKRDVEINMTQPEWISVWSDTLSTVANSDGWRSNDAEWKFSTPGNGALICTITPNAQCSSVLIGLSDRAPNTNEPFAYAPLFVELPTTNVANGTSPQIHRTLDPRSPTTRSCLAPTNNKPFSQTPGISQVALENCILKADQPNTIWMTYDNAQQTITIGTGANCGQSVGFSYKISEVLLLPQAQFIAFKTGGQQGTATLSSVITGAIPQQQPVDVATKRSILSSLSGWISSFGS